MPGNHSRVATVDLTARAVASSSISDEWFKSFLGGRGLAAKLMLDLVPAGTEPYSPDNVLVFATGPITGFSIQGTDRLCVASKSPLTGLLFNCTMGGRFASTLKGAGLDALILRGASTGPVYLVIEDGGVGLCDASHLMGRPPAEVLETMGAQYERFEVCTTGVAAENFVRYAAILHPRANGRWGIAGRGGLGAVMASKNVKAIVVKRSQAAAKTAAGPGATQLRELRRSIQQTTVEKLEGLRLMGTPAGLSSFDRFGSLGTRNLTAEQFEHAEDICGERLKASYYVGNLACHSCSVACGKVCAVGDTRLKNPEYETLYSLGSMMGIGDVEAIIKANALCDDLGLDTMSMGVTLAFAVECFQRGLLTKAETDNEVLRFGDGELMQRLIGRTARREGFGGLLAEGSRRMAQVIGHDCYRFAYQVKGLEIAGHSARALKGMAIGYATGTRGGSHQDARPRYLDDMSAYEGKVEQAIDSQNLTGVGDSLIQCRFVMEAGLGTVLSDSHAQLLAATTGWLPSLAELNAIGERIWHTERLFNVREGASREHDVLPLRVMEEEIPGGPRQGERVPRERLEKMLDSYYEARGCESDGRPKAATLEGLGLHEYISALPSD